MKRKIIFFSAMLLAIGVVLTAQETRKDSSPLLLDDFRKETATIGTVWEGFTDQVMGGVSEISVNRVVISGDAWLRMSGQVSTKNNGGFIQVRLKFPGPGAFNASGYQGIRLEVRGRGDGYYVFLRNNATIFPWKFYKASFKVSPSWQTVDIPWTSFVKGDYGNLPPFSPAKLKSLALSAYGKDFQAELEVRGVSLY